MMRCKPFYEKAEKMNNLGEGRRDPNLKEFIDFCMNDPGTAEKIIDFVNRDIQLRELFKEIKIYRTAREEESHGKV